MAPPVRCADCHARLQQAQQSAGTAMVPTGAAPAQAFAADYLSENPELFRDVAALMNAAAAPLQVRERTFWDWWNDVDVYHEAICGKWAAGHYANEFIEQRIELVNNARQLMHDAIEAQRATQAARASLALESKRAKLAELELDNQIIGALAKRRKLQINVQRHEADAELTMQQTQRAINRVLQPAPTEVEQVGTVISQQRLSVRARSAAKQGIIDDFLATVTAIYTSDESATAKVLKIRANLEAFRQREDALPPEIRGFLKGARESHGR